MDYLADTVAIVRHLSRHPALGSQASRILREADTGQHHIYLSSITLMEVMYLAEAKRIEVALAELVDHVSRSANYSIAPIDAEIVLAAVDVDHVPELHDRILVATAKHLGVPILTGDRVLARSLHVTTIWS
jgi:PIN domain nuclease of toxin-antitoxin system